MAINKAMRLALKALSYPDIDMKKVYKLQRTFQNITAAKVKLPYKMWDTEIDAGDHKVLTRIYEPDDTSRKRRRNKLMLFFHGGGWVTESVDTYNKVCVTLANETGCKVASVEYRLAPEFPFPAGLHDCAAVTREILTNPAELDVKPEDVVLIGDSAGGNFAAVVSMMMRDEGEMSIRSQILLYPATWNDHSENSKFQSVRDNGTDYLLTSKRISGYMELYCADKSDLQSPLVAPLLAENFSDMPRTLTITAEYDPLRDEGEYYTYKLKEAGNSTRLYRMRDALHGFFSLDAKYPQVRKSYKLINRFLDGCDK